MHTLRRAILTIGALVLAIPGALLHPASADSQPWTFQRIQNYPFASDYDLKKVNSACSHLRQQLSTQLGNKQTPERKSAQAFLDEVQAFTDTSNRPGEAYSIEDFATSEDKAIVRLRDEVKLSPPPGGAILRLYDRKETMPHSIRALFPEGTGGVTRWRRYCAVWAGDKSEQEIADTSSHELAHAYIASCLGDDAGRLPRWFHEGAALYLSEGKEQYYTSTENQSRLSYAPRDYNEYRLVFAYMAQKYGAPAVARFIRSSVLRKSVAEPLQTITDYTDYADLRADALAWSQRQKRGYALAAVGLVVGGSAFFWIIGRRRSRRIERALALVEEARVLARTGLTAQALENLSLARRVEPYAASVRLAVQLAEREIGLTQRFA
ncbi:MAG: hypothetical protein IT209_12650 [Armatimonadetes bacterium]|nr:hypothetical protein [Armatimonadota bacterium]